MMHFAGIDGRSASPFFAPSAKRHITRAHIVYPWFGTVSEDRRPDGQETVGSGSTVRHDDALDFRRIVDIIELTVIVRWLMGWKNSNPIVALMNPCQRGSAGRS